MAMTSSSTSRKMPRRSRCTVRSRKNRSTRLSHELLVGVKCMWNRGCRANHFCTWVLVGGVVVSDQVKVPVRRRDRVNHAEELQPLLMAVPVIAHADHGAIQSIQGREQSSGSVALVVVGHGSATSLLQWQ